MERGLGRPRVTNEQLYQNCRDTVEAVRALATREAVHADMGAPAQELPIGDFFVTHADRSVTYCDLVELYYFNECAIRIGYIEGTIAKVRGMPLPHWRPPDAVAK
jgi:hypothetical protein